MGKLRQTALILGEGPTEFFYFKSLCDVFKRLTIKPDYPKHTNIKELDLKIADGIAMGYSHIFCIIDMDTKNEDIREGEPLPCVPFLVSGIVKGYCESKGDGKEHVSCFGYLKGDIVVGISNLSVNVKSLLTIESISSCTMLCVPIPELLKLIEQSPEMMRLYNRALSLAYKKLIEHEDIVANHRAKERYQYFVDTYRDLVDVVSKKDIASYLHLSPESLSRVLKSYKEEK